MLCSPYLRLINQQPYPPMPEPGKFDFPNIYVAETVTSSSVVVGVETAIPAFVGYTEKNLTDSGVSLQNKPTRIASLLEYTQIFGGAQPETKSIKIQIEDRVEQILADQSLEILTNRDVIVHFNPVKKSKFNLYYSIEWYFVNGGGPCYIVSAGNFPANGNGKPRTAKLVSGMKTLEQENEPTMLVVPEALSSGNAQDIYRVALAQAAKLVDRMVIIDVMQSGETNEDIEAFRSTLDDNLEFGAAYYPPLETYIKFHYSETALKITHTKQDLEGATKKGEFHRKALSDVSDQSLYNSIKAQISQIPLQLPPSPGIAAVWVRVDQQRGVWKAPASEPLFNVIRPMAPIDDQTQAGMNIDVNHGKSVNAIRIMPGRGPLVWGGRTLLGNDNEWRYISVRRFFNFVSESVKNATLTFVFEPNDAVTWAKIQWMIETFLIIQWRAGALQGVQPHQAFYVLIGLGHTMTSLDILEGRLIVEIGMAVIRPAEFITLKFTIQMVTP